MSVLSDWTRQCIDPEECPDRENQSSPVDAETAGEGEDTDPGAYDEGGADGPFGGDADGEPPPPDPEPPEPDEREPPDYDDPDAPPPPDPYPPEPPPPPPPDQPEPPPEPPDSGSQYESAVDRARAHARSALTKAINAVLSGLSPAQRSRLWCWFPGATTETLRELVAIWRRARAALGTTDIRIYSDALLDSLGAGALDPDWADHRAARHDTPARVVAQRDGRPLPESDWYIALYQGWLDQPSYRATRMLHEAIHLADPARIHHDRSDRMNNAFSHQGLVSDLSGIPYNPSVVGPAGGCLR